MHILILLSIAVCGLGVVIYFFELQVLRVVIASLGFVPRYRTMRLRRTTLVVLCTFALGFLLAAMPLQKANAQCEVVKLNGPLAAGNHIQNWEYSPDGTHIVYVESPPLFQDSDEPSNLYSVLTAGGSPIRLSPEFAPGGGITNALEISSDNKWVVFGAKQSENEPVQLYSTPIEGGSLTKIAPEDSNSQIGQAFISPDGKSVLYDAYSLTDKISHLYTVPIEGGKRTPLGISNVASLGWKLSADGKYVLAQADTNVDNMFELYGVPITGGQVIEIANPEAGTRVVAFGQSQDDQYFLYQLGTQEYLYYGLYSVPVEGGPSVELTASLPTDVRYIDAGASSPPTYGLNPMGTVVYEALHGDAATELYSVPIGGGTATQLNASPELQGKAITSWTPTSDGQRVVFITDQEGEGLSELHVVSIDGSSVSTIFMLQSTESKIHEFYISPDNKQVVYEIEPRSGTGDPKIEFFSVPIDGGSSVSLATATGYMTPEFSPDGTRVLVPSKSHDGGDVDELYIVSTTGGTVTKLNPTPVEGGKIGFSWFFSRDSAYLFYVADQDTKGMNELYRVDLACAR